MQFSTVYSTKLNITCIECLKTRIFLGTDHGRILILNPEFKELGNFMAGDFFVTGLVAYKELLVVSSANPFNNLMILQLKNFSPIRKAAVKLHVDEVLTMKLWKNYVLVGSKDWSISIWEIIIQDEQNKRPRLSLKTKVNFHTDWVINLEIIDNLMISVGMNDEIAIWNPYDLSAPYNRLVMESKIHAIKIFQATPKTANLAILLNKSLKIFNLGMEILQTVSIEGSTPLTFLNCYDLAFVDIAGRISYFREKVLQK